MADAGHHLFAGLRESLNRVGVPASTQDLVLVPASPGDDAGTRGAITVALEGVLPPARIDRYMLHERARGGDENG